MQLSGINLRYSAGERFPTKGNIDNPDEQQEVDDGAGGGNGPPSDETVQCSFPEGRRQWNADAKAKAAVRAFFDKADTLGEPDLQNREFGALICEFAPGQVELGPIQAGLPILDAEGHQISYPEGRPTVPIPQDGCGSGTPIGYVHSHPGLNTGVPSNSDFDYAKQLIDYHGAPQNVGVYLVTRAYDEQTGAQKDGVTRASLSDKSAANQGTLVPDWINPDATPCPGDG